MKALHNTALEMIKVGKLDGAQRMYETAGQISALTGYDEGVAMSMFSLANLELLRDDGVRALQYVAQSLKLFMEEADRKRAVKLAENIALYLVKEGIAQEAAGKIDEALNLFSLAIPYLKGKRKEAVEYKQVF